MSDRYAEVKHAMAVRLGVDYLRTGNMVMPPEPLPGSMMAPTEFPGAGFVAGDDVDIDAINAYAELVGWRCRFEPAAWPGWRIVYPRDVCGAIGHERETARLGRLERHYCGWCFEPLDEPTDEPS